VSSATKWLLLGLQGTGKTTFLAALWHQLEASELQTAVAVDQLQPDRTYLNRIRDAWLSLKEVPRTSLRAEQSVELHLRHADARIEVTFPDPSGEGLSRLWASRLAPNALVSQARDTSGILLFLHPNRIREGERIPPSAQAADVGSSEEPPWKADTVPTQVQLVDLMQVTMGFRTNESRLPIAVIVSAWDLLKDQLAPDDWVRHRLPLLWQFLTTNVQLDVRYFGISAIGGDLAADQHRLAGVRAAGERVTVKEVSESGTDLTRPLLHLLSGSGS
jgi:hypothetical protein